MALPQNCKELSVKYMHMSEVITVCGAKPNAEVRYYSTEIHLTISSPLKKVLYYAVMLEIQTSKRSDSYQNCNTGYHTEGSSAAPMYRLLNEYSLEDWSPSIVDSVQRLKK